MSDNVLILGAGLSYGARIPLLGGFVERMLDYAVRKSGNGEPLSPADIAIFERAMQIRKDLDRYHGRAEFDEGIYRPQSMGDRDRPGPRGEIGKYLARWEEYTGSKIIVKCFFRL